jgi:hypothetical protein
MAHLHCQGANNQQHTSIAVQETEEMMAKKRKMMMEHRNCIKHIYEFWIENCPEYVYTMEEQKQERKSFHYKKTHNLMYEGKNIKYVKAFLAQKKKKESRKTCYFVNIQKYNNAILFGAEKAGVLLTATYQSEMKKFLQTFRK